MINFEAIVYTQLALRSMTQVEINCETVEKMHHSQALNLLRKRAYEDTFQISS